MLLFGSRGKMGTSGWSSGVGFWTGPGSVVPGLLGFPQLFQGPLGSVGFVGLVGFVGFVGLVGSVTSGGSGSVTEIGIAHV